MQNSISVAWLLLCRHLENHLETPVSVSHDIDARTVTVFGCVAYRVDESGKTLIPGRMDRNGQFQAGGYRVEVLRPLCTSWWLRWVIEDLGLSDRSDQGHLFLSEDEVADAETWLADTAYRLLKADPRFRWIRSEGLPQALNLDPVLVAIALMARACTRGFHLDSDLYSVVWEYECEFRQVKDQNPCLLPLLTVCAQKAGWIHTTTRSSNSATCSWRRASPRRPGVRVPNATVAMAAQPSIAPWLPNSAFLSGDDLVTLTEKRRKSCQIAWLRTSGIPFYVNASNRPIVSRAAIEGIKDDHAPQEREWRSSVLECGR
jgi:Domain of unknown function (DUF4224)